MANSVKWLPGTREGRLNMAKVWVDTISKHPEWKVPEEVLTQLASLYAIARAILAKAQSADRTAAITAECQREFAELAEYLRFIKDRYLKMPPLRPEDLVALLLKIPDTSRTPRGIPKAQRTAEVLRSGTAMLILKYRYAEGTESLADPHTDIKTMIRFGLQPPPGVAPEGLDLTKTPTRPEDLPMVLESSRMKDYFVFLPTDSGKTFWASICISNGKGGYGQWCPLFSAVVP